MFGEDCMSGSHQRYDHAESLEASRLRWLSTRDFQDLLDGEVDFTRAVLENVRQRASDIEEVFSETVFRPVSSRIAAGLLRLCRQESAEVRTIRITHQEVANLAGSTRETTTAVLHSLRNAGVVEIANRRVTVLDIDALRSVARHS
jgi:CRP-like cAMP-binding protein